MLLLAADENFNGNIVRGLFRRQPALDLVRLQDVGLAVADDPYAYERVQEGQPMPGVFEVSKPIARRIGL